MGALYRNMVLAGEAHPLCPCSDPRRTGSPWLKAMGGWPGPEGHGESEAVGLGRGGLWWSEDGRSRNTAQAPKGGSSRGLF